MVGWHHRLNGHGFGWTPGVGDGQAGLACFGSWGRKESDTTEQLHFNGICSTCTHLVMPTNHRILCNPLLLLPSIFPSIRVFPKESALCNNWLKYWSFSFSINSSNEYSGLISIRIEWFYLRAVQGTLKSLLQHNSSKASILRSAFLMIQLSYPYITTGKTIALTI